MVRPLPPAAALAEVAVSLGGTLLDVRHVGRGAGRSGAWSPWLARYTIGEGPAVQLPLAIAGCDAQGSFTLVEAVAGAIGLRLAPTMSGTIVRAGVEEAVGELLARGEHTLRLIAGDRAALKLDALEIAVRVEASTPVQRFRAQLDRPLWLAQAGALALFAVLMVIVQRTPATATALDFDDPEVQARLIKYFEPAPAPTPPPGPAIASAPATRSQAAPVTTPPTPPPTNSELSVGTGPIAQGVTEVAKQSGIFSMADFMAALEESKKDAQASMAKYAVAAKETAVWAVAKVPQSSMLELSGTGRQGGGSARDVVDVEIGLIARTDAQGKRHYGGGKRAAKEAFAERDPAPQPERRTSVVWTASVGRDLIRGVVNRNRPEVRQCFREGMQRNPELRGEVEVAFTIQGDGTVAYPSIVRSTVADPAVEACVKSTVKGWKFPVFVASGGDVDVRFPFTVGAA